MFPTVDRLNPVSQSIPHLENIKEPVIYYKDFNPAFIFALEHPVEGFTTPEEIKQYIGTHGPTYIISQKRYWNDLPEGKQLLHEGKDLFERQETILVKVD